MYKLPLLSIRSDLNLRRLNQIMHSTDFPWWAKHPKTSSSTYFVYIFEKREQKHIFETKKNKNFLLVKRFSYEEIIIDGGGIHTIEREKGYWPIRISLTGHGKMLKRVNFQFACSDLHNKLVKALLIA